MRSGLRFWFACIIAVLGATILASCGSSSSPAAPSPPPPGAKVTAITVTSTQSSPSAIQLKATAQFSDSTSRDVTTSATWESSNPAVATVSAAGVLTVVSSGELDVRAAYQGVTGALHLAVTRVPVTAVTIAGGPTPGAGTFQLTATARLSDGSTQDVTRSATWASSDTSIATVSSTGFVAIVGNGQVDLRATYQGVTGSTHLTVTLPRTFTLSGTVTEVAPNVRPVAGARVQLVGGGHADTDDRGMFSLPGVPVGTAIVEVSKEGYEIWSTEISIPDHDTQITVTLYPTPPTNADGVTATARCNDGSWSWAQTKADACTANGGIAYTVCPGPLCSTP